MSTCNQNEDSEGKHRRPERLSVSVIVPCRNEQRFIQECLDSILDQASTANVVEVLVVDGMSTDATRQLVANYAANDERVQLLDNPKEIVPAALNLGIQRARGDVIVRLDAHSKYPPTYICDCVRLLLKSGAANAGGRVVTSPNGDGPWAIPISRVTAHRFGVGNGAFRTSERPGFVDTVPFGTFRRELFSKIGFFDELLTRNQDNEFNARIIRNGYKIAFDPRIRVEYKNQATLKGLVDQAYFTGMWNTYTFWLFPYTFSPRRIVPVTFVAYLFLLPAGISFFQLPVAIVSPLLIYLLITAGVSFNSNYATINNLRTAITFIAYHVSYGIGSWYGIVNLIDGRWKRFLGKPLRVSLPDKASRTIGKVEEA